MLSRYFPLIGSANWPSINFWICTDAVRTALHSKRPPRFAQRRPRKTQRNIERLTRSSPDSLAATLAAQPSMSLVPLASFLDFVNGKQRSGSVRMGESKSLNLRAQNPTFNEEKLFWLETQCRSRNYAHKQSHEQSFNVATQPRTVRFDVCLRNESG